MSRENQNHIQAGIDGYEAEIEDLQNKLTDSINHGSQLIREKISLEDRVAQLESELCRLVAANRHRDTQDSWRKVTGLRGF